MFKRLFWLSTGAAAGFSGSVWLQRRLRRTVDRFAPSNVQADMRSALREGRDAMRDREAELRQKYSPDVRQRGHR